MKSGKVESGKVIDELFQTVTRVEQANSTPITDKERELDYAGRGNNSEVKRSGRVDPKGRKAGEGVLSGRG